MLAEITTYLASRPIKTAGAPLINISPACVLIKYMPSGAPGEKKPEIIYNLSIDNNVQPLKSLPTF